MNMKEKLELLGKNLKGRIAWVFRERAVLAEPPAESPSTI